MASKMIVRNFRQKHSIKTYLVLVWTETEVLDSLTGVLWASEKEGVASGWGTESELVEGKDLTTGGNDAGTGGSGEAEGGNAELWNSQETVVVSDCTDDDNGLVVGLLRNVGNDSGDRDRWAVDTGHKKATENDLVEGRVGATCRRLLTTPSIEMDILRENIRAKKR